jgi:hypothetical protein
LYLLVPGAFVSDHLLVVFPNNLEPPGNQVQSCPLHASLPRLLTLSYSFELLLEGEESRLEVSVGLLLGTVSLHFGDQPPWPYASHFSQQFVIEVGGAREELIQPGLEGFDGCRVFIILYFFVCVGVSKYFFDKGSVAGGAVAGETCHHSPREESDPVGLFPDVFLEGEHEVGGPLRVVPEIPLRLGMVGGLVLSESRSEFLQLLVSHLVSMLKLL